MRDERDKKSGKEEVVLVNGASALYNMQTRCTKVNWATCKHVASHGGEGARFDISLAYISLAYISPMGTLSVDFARVQLRQPMFFILNGSQRLRLDQKLECQLPGTSLTMVLQGHVHGPCELSP